MEYFLDGVVNQKLELLVRFKDKYGLRTQTGSRCGVG